jgi:hypothetical protein
MPNILTNSLAARLRSFDWDYEYTEDQNVWRKCATELNAFRAEAYNNPIEENNEVLRTLIAWQTDGAGPDHHPVTFMNFVIAHQLSLKTKSY